MFPILLFLMTAAYILLAAFIVLIVLIQPGKSGGGLGGLGGGSTAGSAITETLGATQAEKSLARWTMYAGVIFGGLALALTLLGSLEQRSLLALSDEPSSPAVITINPQGAGAPATSGEALAIEVPSAPASEAAPATDAPATE
jgi:protein translocase SecG subunit